MRFIYFEGKLVQTFNEKLNEDMLKTGGVERPMPDFDRESQTCLFEDGNWKVADIPEPSYDEVISEGYLDKNTGSRLRASVQDQNRFTSLVARISLGIQMGSVSNDTPQTISDFNGKALTLSAAELSRLLLRYGSWCDDKYRDSIAKAAPTSAQATEGVLFLSDQPGTVPPSPQ